MLQLTYLYEIFAKPIFPAQKLLKMFFNRHLYPLQVINCCRPSRLVVDEDDLERVTNVLNLPDIVKKFCENVHLISTPAKFYKYPPPFKLVVAGEHFSYLFNCKSICTLQTIANL